MYAEPTLIVLATFLPPFIFVIIMAWIKSVEQRKRNELLADLYTKAIEKGEKLPADLFEMSKKKKSSLKTGIILVSLGVGIFLFIWIARHRIDEAAVGLIPFIPFILGIGFLIIHLIWKKQGIEDEA